MRVKTIVSNLDEQMDETMTRQLSDKTLHNSLGYHRRKRRKLNQLRSGEGNEVAGTIEISSDEETDESDLDSDDLQEMRKRNLRRAKAREMDKFCRKLKAQPDFRKALRPGVPNHNTFMVPLDQISSQHDIILSQEPKQREVIQNSTRLSIDNNHKCAPWWAERTISMRSLLHNRQWVWVGDFLCLRKDQELHRRAAKMLFDKCCTCEGTGRGCALNGIKAICSDFETGLWRPFLEELHKHQSD